MKYKLGIIVGIAAVMAVKTAQAIPDTLAVGNVLNGNSYLASASTPGNLVYVNWAVDLQAGVYTYSYQLYNSSVIDTVDSLNVSFATGVPGALIAGNYDNASASGVTWFLQTALNPGDLSGQLYFTSRIAPTFGNANAADANPPSPWASVPGGQQVPVPAVPDGGTTVMLLGAALSAMGLLRRKLIA